MNDEPLEISNFRKIDLEEILEPSNIFLRRERERENCNFWTNCGRSCVITIEIFHRFDEGFGYSTTRLKASRLVTSDPGSARMGWSDFTNREIIRKTSKYAVGKFSYIGFLLLSMECRLKFRIIFFNWLQSTSIDSFSLLTTWHIRWRKWIPNELTSFELLFPRMRIKVFQ